MSSRELLMLQIFLSCSSIRFSALSTISSILWRNFWNSTSLSTFKSASESVALSRTSHRRKIWWGVRAAYLGLLLLNASLDGFAKTTSRFEYITGLVWPAPSRQDTSMGVVVPVEKRVNRISPRVLLVCMTLKTQPNSVTYSLFFISCRTPRLCLLLWSYSRSSIKQPPTKWSSPIKIIVSKILCK